MCRLHNPIKKSSHRNLPKKIFILHTQQSWPTVFTQDGGPSLGSWAPLAYQDWLRNPKKQNKTTTYTCTGEKWCSRSIHKQTVTVDKQLKSEIQEQSTSWAVTLVTIELVVQGFVGHLLPKCLSLLGFSHSNSTKLCKMVSLVSAKCSYAIYLTSNSPNWDRLSVLLGPAEIS